MKFNFTTHLIEGAILGLGMFLLTSCDSPEENAQEIAPKELSMNMPEGLKDCKTYLVHSNEGYSSIMVTRCPNSATITTTGKGSVTVTEHAVEEEQ